MKNLLKLIVLFFYTANLFADVAQKSVQPINSTILVSKETDTVKSEEQCSEEKNKTDEELQKELEKQQQKEKEEKKKQEKKKNVLIRLKDAYMQNWKRNTAILIATIMALVLGSSYILSQRSNQLTSPSKDTKLGAKSSGSKDVVALLEEQRQKFEADPAEKRRYDKDVANAQADDAKNREFVEKTGRVILTNRYGEFLSDATIDVDLKEQIEGRTIVLNVRVQHNRSNRFIQWLRENVADENERNKLIGQENAKFNEFSAQENAKLKKLQEMADRAIESSKSVDVGTLLTKQRQKFESDPAEKQIYDEDIAAVERSNARQEKSDENLRSNLKEKLSDNSVDTYMQNKIETRNIESNFAVQKGRHNRFIQWMHQNVVDVVERDKLIKQENDRFNEFTNQENAKLEELQKKLENAG